MVKIPKEQRRFCPSCKKHTVQTVKEEKKGKTAVMKKRYRHRQEIMEKGYGGFPYENPAHRTRGKKNPTSKKRSVVFKCKDCSKSNKPNNVIRAAKFEIV